MRNIEGRGQTERKKHELLKTEKYHDSELKVYMERKKIP